MMARRRSAARVGRSTTPERRMCGAMEVYYRIAEEFPAFRQRQMTLEHAFNARRRSVMAARAAPFKIQVVVHIVHNTPAEKISMAQVNSQIAVLNRDFRGKNPDKTDVPTVWQGMVADAMIEFELATKDPDGNPTKGVTFTATAETSFGSDDTVKSSSTGGANPWDPTEYLNIWVCTLSGGLLGYAQFPGGPVSTDGVVCLNTAFGTTGTASAPFNLGRTTTHEVGHYLNLRHIWGDTPDCSGSDFVDDTPNAEGPNFGKPTFPSISCGNGPNGDMFMNYMDYVDDDSMFMFTPEQVARMHTTLEGVRKSLVT